MPSGSNASRRSGHQLRGDENAIAAAGGKSIMKRGKRVAERSVEGGANKKRFVGVRQRPSGRWVAEIKDTTQKIRLWLGTFDSAEEGAKAYDSAARALRGANTRTNFVAAIASSCESTVPTKAARLIRLRQTAAAANTTPCELRHKPSQATSGQHLDHENWDTHDSQEDTISQSTITSESHSSAINHSLGDSAEPDHPRLTCNDGASTPAASSPAPTDTELRDASGGNELHPSQESFPCATNMADEEASSFVDDNEAMDPIHDNSNHGTRTAACQHDAMCKKDMELVARSDVNDPLDHRLDMIPWPEYVLMEGLDLNCETTSSTGVYPAFEYSTEAMDRDSEQYLSDDSSDFLLRLQQPPISQHTNEIQNQCELPRPPVCPDEAGECPGQGDQALWGDLPSLCMVA